MKKLSAKMDNTGNAEASSDLSKNTATPVESNSNHSGCGCSSASTITVCVTPTTGGQFDLQVSKTDSVESLKKLISKKLKVPKERICLLHRDRQLREGSLEENNLMDGSRLTLLPSVETGLLAQRPEQSVMQALESLNDSQVNDFLSGKAPLNLTMRLGDHMMLIQLQLSTVTPSSTRRSGVGTTISSVPSTVSTSTANSSTTNTTSTSGTSLTSKYSPISTQTDKSSTPASSILLNSRTPSLSSVIASPGKVTKQSVPSTVPHHSNHHHHHHRVKSSQNSGPSSPCHSPTTSHQNSVKSQPRIPPLESETPVRTQDTSVRTTDKSMDLAKMVKSIPSPISKALSTSTQTPTVQTITTTTTTTGSLTTSTTTCSTPNIPSVKPTAIISSPKVIPTTPTSRDTGAKSSSTPTTPVSGERSPSVPVSPSCKCDQQTVKPTLDTRALAEASRNLTQTLKQLSSEVLTSRSDPAEDAGRARRQGAIIESMHHHGKGVYSGTFSGTLNPALQDRFGRPKRDISTIIHILNDLLCATPQYRRHRQGASADASGSPSKQSSQTSDKSNGTDLTDEASSLSRENQATRGKLEQLRLIMEERRAKRRARREARSAPYMTQWSAKSESVQQGPSGSLSHEPMDTTEQGEQQQQQQQLCEVTPPEPVVA